MTLQLMWEHKREVISPIIFFLLRRTKSRTLCCCRGLVGFSLFVFSRAEFRTVFWIWVLADRSLLLWPLPSVRLRSRRGRSGWDVDAGGWRADGPVGLLGQGLSRRVSVRLELGGVGLGLRGVRGVLPVPLSFQLFGFLKLRLRRNTNGQK